MSDGLEVLRMLFAINTQKGLLKVSIRVSGKVDLWLRAIWHLFKSSYFNETSVIITPGRRCKAKEMSCLLLVSGIVVADFQISSVDYSRGQALVDTIVTRSVDSNGKWFVKERHASNISIQGEAAEALIRVLNEKVEAKNLENATFWTGKNIRCFQITDEATGKVNHASCELNVDQMGEIRPGVLPEPRGGGSVSNC